MGPVKGNQEKNSEMRRSDIHRMLSNGRRRNVLFLLDQHDTPLAVKDLAEEIATRETGTSPPDQSTRQSVYISLIQTHLPRLDELGIVQYDESEKLVRPASNHREVTSLLNPPHEELKTLRKRVLACCALGGGFVLGAALGIPGLQAVGAAPIALVTLVAIVVITIIDVGRV